MRCEEEVVREKFEDYLKIEKSRESAIGDLVEDYDKRGELEDLWELVEKHTEGLMFEIQGAISRKKTLKDLEAQTFSYEAIPINEEVEVRITEHFLDVLETKSHNSLSYEIKGRIYLAKRGVGHREFFLYVNGVNKLQNGENRLCLRKMEGSEVQRILSVLDTTEIEKVVNPTDGKNKNAKHKIYRNEDGFIGVYQDNLSDTIAYENQCIELDEFLRDYFYELIPPVHPDYVRFALKKKGIDGLLKDFFGGQYEYDPELVYFVRSNLITYGTTVNPNFMKYQPHTLMITNTKVGKSYLYKKVCRHMKFDRASPANLLGFAGAKKSEVKEGTLNGEYGNSCWDDLEKNFGEGIIDDLPTILEGGDMKIAKGCYNLITRFSGAVTITTNTKGEALDLEDLVLQVMEIVNKISSNPERCGGRFGAFVVVDNWTTARGTHRLTDREMKINERIVLQTFNEISELAGRLLEDEAIVSFLETEDKEYSAKIEEMVKQSSLTKQAKALLISFIHGYKHQKGLAFKQGLITYFTEKESEAEKALTDPKHNPDKEELLKSIKEEWEEVKGIQLTMINRFITGAQNRLFFLDNLPNYLKALLLGLDNCLSSEPARDISKPIHIEALNEHFDRDLKSYNQVSTVVSRFPKSLERVNRQLEELGVQVLRIDGSYFIKVSPNVRETFQNYGLKEKLLKSLKPLNIESEGLSKVQDS